jgi:hypothetical protein
MVLFAKYPEYDDDDDAILVNDMQNYYDIFMFYNNLEFYSHCPIITTYCQHQNVSYKS